MDFSTLILAFITLTITIQTTKSSTVVNETYCTQRQNSALYFPSYPNKCIHKVGGQYSLYFSDPENFQCAFINGNYSTNRVCQCINNFVPINDNLICVEGRNINEFCSNGNPCKSNLQCSSTTAGKCECKDNAVLNTNDLLCYSDKYCEERFNRNVFYVNSTGKCTAYLRRIAFTNEISCNSTTISCPENSSCHQDSTTSITCTCNNPNFIRSSSQKKCLQIKNHDESCENSDGNPCNRTQNTRCHRGTCNCYYTGMYSHTYLNIWDPIKQSCKTRLGNECDSDNTCISNAECYRNEYNGKKQCKCRQDYVAFGQDACKGMFKSKCISNSNCHESLVCVDGICQCRDVINQIYKDTKCFTRVGSNCATTTGNFTSATCVQNAYCNTNEGICKCNVGYQESNNKARCFKVKKFGENCSASECNLQLGLACINNKCNCADTNLEFYNNNGACLASIGSICGKREVMGSCLYRSTGGNCEYYTVNCKSGAECKQDPRNKEISICTKFGR